MAREWQLVTAATAFQARHMADVRGGEVATFPVEDPNGEITWVGPVTVGEVVEMRGRGAYYVIRAGAELEEPIRVTQRAAFHGARVHEGEPIR